MSPGMKRNLLYLNSMSLEMMKSQKRIWEIRSRDLGGYCRRCCSIFFGSEKNRIIEIKPEKNICYCIQNSPLKINMSLFRYLYRIFFFIILTFRVKEICRKNMIDAIISQSNALRELELASIIVSKIYRIPMLGYIGRNFTALSSNKNLLEKIIYRIEVAILHSADKVIMRPASEDILSKYYRINPVRIVTIPHTTRFHKFSGFSEIPVDLKEWIAGRKLVLYYGRLEEDKLVEDIIKSFHIVKNSFDNVLLLLIGFGKDKNKLEQLSNKLGIEDSARWKPPMSQEELVAISKRADIHIHPTGGKGLLESAVMGRPVILYDSHSYDYGLVEHMKTGLKARFRSFESIAECVIKYLENQNLGIILGEALRKKACAENDLISVQKKLSSAIEKIIIEKHH